MEYPTNSGKRAHDRYLNANCKHRYYMRQSCNELYNEMYIDFNYSDSVREEFPPNGGTATHKIVLTSGGLDIRALIAE